MALNKWQRAKITSVFSPVGTHSNGDVKYIRRKFDVMRWKKPGGTEDETFVVSPTADSSPPISLLENANRPGLRDVVDEGLSQDFGWYTADRLVVALNHDPKNGDDENLLDFHFFGPV